MLRWTAALPAVWYFGGELCHLHTVRVLANSPDAGVIGLITARFLAALFLQAAVVLRVANSETSARSLLVRAGVDFAGAILSNARCLVL